MTARGVAAVGGEDATDDGAAVSGDGITDGGVAVPCSAPRCDNAAPPSEHTAVRCDGIALVRPTLEQCTVSLRALTNGDYAECVELCVHVTEYLTYDLPPPNDVRASVREVTARVIRLLYAAKQTVDEQESSSERATPPGGAETADASHGIVAAFVAGYAASMHTLLACVIFARLCLNAGLLPPNVLRLQGTYRVHVHVVLCAAVVLCYQPTVVGLALYVLCAIAWEL
jgi:hypothetical protein